MDIIIGKYNFPNHIDYDAFNGVQFELKNGVNPIVLTGVSILCEFRKKQENGSVSLSLSVGNGITIDDAINGIFSLDTVNSLNLTKGIHYYTIKFTFANGVVKTYIKGEMTVV